MDNLTGHKTKIEKIVSYALAALLPIIIMGAAFAFNGIYPFGGQQIILGDFGDQYYPFISDLWHKLHEGSSLLWSWTAGAGHDYLPLIAYYMASPFNLLAALTPHALLREALTAFLLIKLGLAGLFMSLYLRYAAKQADILLPVFASLYALSAFTLGYYCNIMWFDTLALFPLVMLGLHKLVNGGKFALYVLSLAAAVIFNFYIGFFVCVFAAMWFFILCAAQKLKPRDILNKLALIAGFSALAIGLTAFITLPAYAALQHTYGAVLGNAFPDALRLRHSFFAVLGNLLAFTPPTFELGLPNLYCGMISIMLAPVFLLTKKIRVREKLAYLLAAAFLLISTNVNVLEYIWHGFSYTTALPSRYSFLFTFVLIVMAYRAYISTRSQESEDWSQNKKERNSWFSLVSYGYKLLAMGGCAAFFLIMAALGPQETKYVIWNTVLCGVYLCLFAIPALGKRAVYPPPAKGASQRKYQGAVQPHSKEKRWRGVLKPLMFVLIITELTVTAYLGVQAVGTAARADYPPGYNDVQQLLDIRQPADNDFYRTEFARRATWGDNSLYGYQGVSIWASLADIRAVEFMVGLGLSGLGIDNTYKYYAETSPLTNAFLNMRYIISDVKPIDDGVFWQRKAVAGKRRLLENTRYLPLGFIVNGETAGFKGYGGVPYKIQEDIYGRGEGYGSAAANKGQTAADGGRAADNPFSAQNDLFRRATGLEGDLFALVDISNVEIINIEPRNYELFEQGSGKYAYTLAANAEEGILIFDYKMPAGGNLYIYAWVEGANYAKIAVENSLLQDIEIHRPYILRAGSFKQGDLVSVAARTEAKSGEAWVYAAILDQELFDQGYALLADETLELTEFKDTKISGRITVKEDGLLYTSIPHAGLWRAWVDGGEVEIVTIDGAMAAVWLEAGEHTVEFRYHNKALLAGAIISAAAALVFLGMVIARRRKGFGFAS